MYNYLNKAIAVFLCAVISITTHMDIDIETNAQRAETETDAQMTETETNTQLIEMETEAGTQSEEVRTEVGTQTIETELGGMQETEIEEGIRTAETEIDMSTMETGAENETDNRLTDLENESKEEGEIELDTKSDMELTETDTEERIETETGIETETEAVTAITEIDVDEEILRLREMVNNKLELDGFVPSGYIDSGIEAELLPQGQQTSFFSVESSAPVRYSAVENGQTTSIRNQGGWGACWAFAAVAAAESAYKKIANDETDMSETHLINFLYNDNIAGPDGGLEGDAIIPLRTEKVDNGGNSMFTTFAMARWTGIADEQTDKSLVYPSEEDTKKTKELHISQEYAYTDIVHLQNSYWINKNDMDFMKKAIMDYGAIATYYLHDEACSSNYVDKEIYSGPAVYYNYQDYGTGHAVAIVGWDDNFDKNNFRYTALNQDKVFIDAGICFIPQNDGAWLVKNSWGSDYGDDGYFWMSYEDASLSDTVFAFEFEKADNYDHIYQYDGSAGVRYESGEAVTAAAIYKSTGNQMIEAVGVGIASADTNYAIEVYTDLSDVRNPQSGKLCSQAAGAVQFQGYHTIKLDEYAAVADGEYFSIVVRLTEGVVEGEKQSAIFIDRSYDNGGAVRFVANTNPNETFLKTEDGWQDAVDKGTYRIKAYTSDSEFDIPQENRTLTPEMIKEIENQEYNGKQNEPDIEISYMGELLIKDIDFSVVYMNNNRAADKTDVDAPRAMITGIGKYAGTVEQTFTIERKKLVDEMVESAAMMYNGTVQNDLSLRNGEVFLEKEVDYQIVFNKQPCNVGSYTATITGINNYIGEISVPVTITKTIISEDMVVVANQTEYTGTANKVTVKVITGGLELPASNYSIAYKNNTNVGMATVTVTGKVNCQGKVTKTFEILPKSIISDDISVTVTNKTYTGKELLPPVVVKWGKKTLKKGKDYTVTYANNTHAADKEDTEAPRATITGVGNYEGTREIYFTILPKEIAESSISVQISYHETGEGSESLAEDDNGSSIRVLLDKTELTSAQYRAVVYNAGTSETVVQPQLAVGTKYDIQITLQGDYIVKGKEAALKKNIVCKKDIGDLAISFKDSEAVYTYNAKAQKPLLTIEDQNGNVIPKTQYTISYADNINAGTARVIVTGKGDYAGIKQISFDIEKQRLDNLVIQPIKDQTYAQKEICPTVKVLNGKKVLKSGEGKDYTYTYSNNIDVTYDNTEVIAGAYVEIQLSDNYKITKESQISGNYKIAEGTNNRVIANFKIVPAKISSISLSNAYYSGQAVIPEKVAVKAGKLEVPLDCYDITADQNINVTANAQLTVTAKAATNYTGSKTKKYRITKLELKKLLLPVIPNQPYLGQPVDVSHYTIKLPSGEDIGQDQYSITMKNNKRPGKATITYKAASNGLYKGSVTVKFNIVKATISQAIDFEAAKMIYKPYTGEEITLTEEELRMLAPIKGTTGEYKLPYTITYSKNINAGKAVVSLKGNDYLQGSMNMHFTIVPKSSSSFKITTGEKQLSYNNGIPVYLELKEVADGDKILQKGKDYTYAYVNADKQGTACLTISGVGNYTGTRYIYYRIR